MLLPRPTHEFQSFNPSNVRTRIAFECFETQRAAERDHPFAMFDSRKPVAARDGLLANGAVYVCAVRFSGVEDEHIASSCHVHDCALSVVEAATPTRPSRRAPCPAAN